MVQIDLCGAGIGDSVESEEVIEKSSGAPRERSLADTEITDLRLPSTRPVLQRTEAGHEEAI